MTTVDRYADDPPGRSLAACPTCTEPASVGDYRLDGGVMWASYVCPRGHPWMTHWPFETTQSP